MSYTQKMKQLIANNQLILMEAAIVERLRRSDKVHLHDSLVNAPLIYDQTTRRVMSALYKSYMDLALRAKTPMLICTPTWRANKARVYDSYMSKMININAANYMRELRDLEQGYGKLVKIGGMIGCKNDCYQPNEGLSIIESQHFHSWQIEQLTEGGVDFLIAETLPNVHEALGIAKAMEPMGLPYIISFVIARNGCVLDGTSLKEAIDFIDTNTVHSPLGYMVNCAHPSFLCPQEQPKEVFSRLIGYQANASSLDHCELDGAAELKAESISEWGQLMLELNHTYGIKILGGCCGTGIEHLQFIVANGKS